MRRATSNSQLIIPPKEVQKKKNLNLRKAPGIARVTPKMRRELSRKGVGLTTHIFNAIHRVKYWPMQLKMAEIILIPKPDRPEQRVLPTNQLTSSHFQPPGKTSDSKNKSRPEQ